MDLDKVIATLQDRDKKLKQAIRKSDTNNEFLNELYRVKAKEVDAAKKEVRRESVLKESAIAKMEELRGEVALLQGDEASAINMMREEVRSLKDIIEGYRVQNTEL